MPRAASVTVRRLVGDPSLRLSLVGGAAFAGNKVRSAHTIDLDAPGRYVLPGELVLTNGLWLPLVSADEWVAEVAAAGGSGVVFGLSDTVRAVPAELPVACERHRLPLLQAPGDVSFGLLSEHVAGLGQPVAGDGLRREVHRARQVADVVAAGGGYAGLLDVLRRQAGLTGCFVGPGDRVLARTGRPLPRRTLALAVRAALDGALPAAVGDAAAFCAPGRRTRSVLLVAAPLHVLDDATLLLVEQLCVHAALEDARGDVDREVRGQLAGELLARLRRGQATDADVAARLESLGLDPAGALRAIAVDAEAVPPRLLVHAVESMSRPYALTRSESDWLLLVDDARDDDAVGLAAAVRALGAEPVLGWGGRGHGGEALRRSASEAVTCLARARLRPPHDRLVGPLDVASRPLLLAQLDGATARSFAERVLEPLVAWDVRHAARLVETLRTFLAEGGQWSRTAQALHVHQNTLRYRLSRVEELTGRSLADSGDRVDLFLALELLDRQG